MGPNETPWDIYADERKVCGDYAIGFLIVPNTASFLHKLYLLCNVPPMQMDEPV